MKYAPTPQSHMNAAAKVVTNNVGSRMMRAMPTQTTVKTTAPRTARMRATTSAKTNTVMVRIRKRPMGREESDICERRKD